MVCTDDDHDWHIHVLIRTHTVCSYPNLRINKKAADITFCYYTCKVVYKGRGMHVHFFNFFVRLLSKCSFYSRSTKAMFRAWIFPSGVQHCATVEVQHLQMLKSCFLSNQKNFFSSQFFSVKAEFRFLRPFYVMYSCIDLFLLPAIF